MIQLVHSERQDMSSKDPMLGWVIYSGCKIGWAKASQIYVSQGCLVEF